MSKLLVAVQTYSLQVPLKKALHTAARLGARGVELDVRNELPLEEMSDTGVRAFRKMLEDLNLRVVSLRFQTRRGYDNPNELDRRIDATKQAMRLGYKLGAAHVVNQIGQVPDDPEQPRWQQLAGVMDDLGRFGAKVGTFLAAETGTEPGANLARLLGTLENAYVAVAFNPGKLILNRFPVRESLEAVAGDVGVVIAQDAVQDLAAGRGIEVPLGQGVTDFPELLGILENQHYRGPIVVGSAAGGDTAEVADAIEFLNRL